MEEISWLTGYRGLREGAGQVDFADRTRIELKGEDRAAFFHNLCTNEIRRLPIGSGCEAFITNVQGKTLAHVLVFAQPDELVLETVPQQAELILTHLEKYHIREKVEITDRGQSQAEIFVAGPQAETVLQRLAGGNVPSENLHSIQTTLAGQPVWLRRADLVGGPGFLLQCALTQIPKIAAALAAAGVVECPAEAFEAARIEAGFPMFGRDITDKNLPQEVGRDAQAISFTKGCYLGQETVARIDALGHVNRLLVGVAFEPSTMPAAGQDLSAAGQKIGVVMSTSYSPQLKRPLGLAYVRRASSEPGTRLDSEVGAAEVVRLPLA